MNPVRYLILLGSLLLFPSQAFAAPAIYNCFPMELQDKGNHFIVRCHAPKADDVRTTPTGFVSSLPHDGLQSCHARASRPGLLREFRLHSRGPNFLKQVLRTEM